MQNTVAQYIAGIASDRDKAALLPVISAGCNLDSSQMLSSAAIAITAAASTTASAVAASYAMANGVVQKIAAATVLPALVGTVVNGTFNMFCFYADSGGNLTSAMGTAGATIPAMQFPPLPIKQALIGFIIINPTGAGNFIGSTTPLDSAGVVPNAVYINTVGGFDASIKLN